MQKFLRKYFCCQNKRKAIFYDLVQSVKCIRIRLYINLKKLNKQIKSIRVNQNENMNQEFQDVNPFKNDPFFQTPYKTQIIETSQIIEYLEQKYGNIYPKLMPQNKAQKACVNYLVKLHDIFLIPKSLIQCNFKIIILFITNQLFQCNIIIQLFDQFLVNQGIKPGQLSELWKYLNLLENKILKPYMNGNSISLADLTWYPTAIILKFIMKRVFQWPLLFGEYDYFPNLTNWFDTILNNSKIFEEVHDQLWFYWQIRYQEGYFNKIQLIIQNQTQCKWKYP